MKLLSTLCVASLLVVGCNATELDRDPGDGFLNHNRPAGRLEGSIVYDGPPPSVDAQGVPLGRVVLLLFRADNLPPPQGFATSAVSVQTVPASVLFANVTAGANGVRATAPFMFPNIVDAGHYQLRAFYSNRPEDRGFHPVYGVRASPQRGDVGGGAVVNPAASPPVFNTLTVGDLQSNGAVTMPLEGAVVRGVTVFLGAPIVEDRPAFHTPSNMVQAFTGRPLEAPPQRPAERPAWARRTGFNLPPAEALILASNVASGDAATFLGALPALTLQAGLQGSETQAAVQAGVTFSGPLSFSMGVPYRPVHPTLFLPPASPGAAAQRFPWVFPLVLLVKLHDPTPDEAEVLAAPTLDPTRVSRVVASLNRPESNPPVVIFGSVVPERLSDFAGLVRPPPAPPVVTDRTRVLFPPMAFEIRGANPERDWRALVPRLPAPLAAALQGALPPGSRCLSNGLPEGRYGLTVVTARGATWSVPNELAPSALLPGAATAAASQGAVVRIERSDAPAGTECPPGLQPE